MNITWFLVVLVLQSQNKRRKELKQSISLKTTHFEVFWGLRLAPLSTPNPHHGSIHLWRCMDLTIVVFFCLRVPFQYCGATISAQSVNLEKKGVIWHVRGPLNRPQLPPTCPMGGHEPVGDTSI